MNIEKLFKNKHIVNEKYKDFINKKQLIKIEKDNNLVLAHLNKSKHNMLFFDKNSANHNFDDWLIVTLYYSLYHAALALIVHKNYKSKNHTASLIFLIQHYHHLTDEIKLLYDLSIKKEDAELYTELKEDRHKASYETKHNYSQDKINEYKLKVIDFIHKTEEIIRND